MQAKTQVIHDPRLNTILMIEEAIKNAGDYPSRTELWKRLPRQTMYQSYKRALDYLIQSRKVMLTKDDKLMWIFADSLKAKKLLKESVKVHV